MEATKTQPMWMTFNRMMFRAVADFENGLLTFRELENTLKGIRIARAQHEAQG